MSQTKEIALSYRARLTSALALAWAAIPELKLDDSSLSSTLNPQLRMSLDSEAGLYALEIMLFVHTSRGKTVCYARRWSALELLDLSLDIDPAEEAARAIRTAVLELIKIEMRGLDSKFVE